MKVIVIGGAGFIGSNLCRRFLDNGHEVICLDNCSLGSEENVSYLMDRNGFVFIRADVNDEEQLVKLFSNNKPDYIFHLAAHSDIRIGSMNPFIDYTDTYSSTFHILSAMRKNGLKKLFFASTSAVYGDRRGEILSEDCTFPSPISYYGASKLGSEALIQAFAYMNDMSVLIFRISNAIGPHMTHGVIRDFVRKLYYDNHTLEILGDGNQEKPFIYIQDLIDAIMQFMDVPKGVSIFNVGSEGVTTIKKVADIICEEMGLNNVKYSFTGGEGGWKGDVPRFIYNVDKINDAGWKAKYNSDEAVRMAVRDILKQESVNYSG